MWTRLSAQLEPLGYEAVVVLPTAADEYPAGNIVPHGTVQEAFVNVGWIKEYRLTVTPTSLLFDRNGKLLWAHQGVLSSGDLVAASHAVEQVNGVK